MNTEKYFKDLRKDVQKVYDVAEEAKKKGLDPKSEVEIPLAMSMAEKVVGLISVVYPQVIGSGIDKRITELEKEYGKLDPTVVFKIGEEVAKQKFCKFASLLEAMDAGIRIGFAYQTIAVVASPIEGYTGIRTRKTQDGKDYIEASFSGPIRSAGTTASCVALMLIDYLRELLGFAKYDPTEDEIKRVWAELEFFHDRITNLQYMPLEEEALFLAKNMPFQVAGDPSEKLEVPNYKNLERVDTDFLRSGFCLVMAEGLAQKGPKAFRLYNKSKGDGVEMTGFDFLQEYIELHEKLTSKGTGEKKKGVPTYIRDLVAGRPVYGHPSRSGGFRFRYGRARTSGFSAASIHPATMGITESFIANGTQLKIEKPTKGCVVTSCDKIGGPIVKMFNGSVRKPKTTEEALKMYPDVEEIIYLGDILFPFSDVLNRNYDLLKPGYVEEWWDLELRKNKGSVKDCYAVEFDEAAKLSKEFDVPLNPKFIFYWTEISKEQFLGLVDWLKHSRVSEGKIIFCYNKTEQDKFEIGKRALELLGVEHEVSIENVLLEVENSKALFANMGLDLKLLEGGDCLLKDFVNETNFSPKDEQEVFDVVNNVSEFKIKNKAGDFIGTRMGRPEKAKLRKLTGSPNVLFPVGKEGGRLRSVNVAFDLGAVRGQFPIFNCSKCDNETIYPLCEKCNSKTDQMFYCRECKEKSKSPCKEHERGDEKSCYQEVDMKKYFNSAVEKLGLKREELPALIKGIRGTSSENHVMEHLSKGI